MIAGQDTHQQPEKMDKRRAHLLRAAFTATELDALPAYSFHNTAVDRLWSRFGGGCIFGHRVVARTCVLVRVLLKAYEFVGRTDSRI